MRTFLFGVAAIALLALAAFGGIWWLTRDTPATPPAAAGAPAEAGPPPPLVAPPPLPAAVQEELRTHAATPVGFKPVAPTPRPYEPPRDTWEAVPITARPAGLGRVGALVWGELAALQEKIAACFLPEVAAESGTTKVAFAQDLEGPADAGATVLLLQLETAAGSVRIVDAPVRTKGGADEATLACAQRVLRGRTFQIPAAQPGGRHRLQYILHP